MRHILTVAAIALLTYAAQAETKPRIGITDGDTITVNGTSTRLRNHNAPETAASRGKFKAKCPHELELAEKSKARLGQIVRKGEENGTLKLGPIVARDKYRRDVRVLEVDGEDVGKTLRREGLAKRNGRKDFCH